MFQVLLMVNQWYYQNVQYVVVKCQEAEALLSNVVVRTPLSRVPIVRGDFVLNVYAKLYEWIK